MTVDCENCPLRKLSIFDNMTDDEVSFMSGFKVDELTVPPGAPVLMEGAHSAQLFTVLSGLGKRFKTLEDGRRQIINFVMPGDFVGLQAAVAGEMRHSIEATTAMTLCVFRRADIWRLFETHPSRAYDITWLGATEEHFLGETLASIGQRSAIERLAWGLVRVWQRAEHLDLLTPRGFAFPYRQQDLADMLGLSLVHTNKTLAKLRERGFVDWADNHLKLHDVDGLKRIALLSPDANTDAHRPLI